MSVVITQYRCESREHGIDPKIHQIHKEVDGLYYVRGFSFQLVWNLTTMPKCPLLEAMIL